MSSEGMIKRGKKYSERMANNFSVPTGVDENHPDVKAYQESTGNSTVTPTPKSSSTSRKVK
tara:strand:+ start:89 stop:271 length:183 start_codon:yes stop_codon:yes gene_type:complete